MTGPAEPRGDCSENIDPTRLIRHGTSQAERAEVATLSARATVDERRPEHAIVFASAYAQYLRYADLDGTTTTDWKVFFASDLSAQLAVPAIEDVAVYRTTVTALLRELENPVAPDGTSMVRALGAVFDCLGTLALRLDDLATTLPPAHRLRATIGNLVRSQLSVMLRRLIGYHRAGLARGVVDATAPPPGDLLILGTPVRPFWRVTTIGLSAPEWTAGSGVADWAGYLNVDPSDYTGAYGDGTVVEQVNHLATHNQFTAACEAFLAVHARVVDEARAALEESFKDPGHAPHYALFMAFLRLFEHARTEMNTLTGKHLTFYYRNVLGLGKQPAEPSHAHLLVQLAKPVERHLIAEGTLLKAGKDAQGTDAYFVTDRELVANKGAVAELKSLYRHPADGPLRADRGRIFARPAVDTESGASWHPFVEEVLTDGQVTSIDMPPAQVGFAIASHHLWMAEGKRTVHVSLATNPASKEAFTKLNLLCRLTTTKGWIDKVVDSLSVDPVGRLVLEIGLAGSDPPVTPYDAATHGYSFATSLPVLLVLLAHEDQHRNTVPWDYPRLVDKDLVDVTVRVDVKGLKSVTLSNDQGPVDGSKPFLAYGSTPTANSSLVIGSKEVFQKGLSSLRVDGTWMSTPKPSSTNPSVTVQFLANGTWTTPVPLGDAVVEPHYTLTGMPSVPPGSPDLTPDAPYTTTSRAGFFRLALTDGFGTASYPGALASWIVTPTGNPPEPPVLPMLQSLTLGLHRRAETRARAAVGGRRAVLPRHTVRPCGADEGADRDERAPAAAVPRPLPTGRGRALHRRGGPGTAAAPDTAGPGGRRHGQPARRQARQPHHVDLPARRRLGPSRRRRGRGRHRRPAGLRHRDDRRPRRRDHGPHPAARGAAVDPAGGGLEERRRMPPAHRCGAGARTLPMPSATRAPMRSRACSLPGPSTSSPAPDAVGQEHRPALPDVRRAGEGDRRCVHGARQRAPAAQGPPHRPVGLRTSRPRGIPVDLPGAVPQPHPVRPDGERDRHLP